MRKSYVQINGQLYEKGEDNSVVISGEKWYCIAGRWTPLGALGESAMVMPDIQPYTSMIDGSQITSRSRHREHLRDHGCIEVGNERITPKGDSFSPVVRGLREELSARLNQGY